MQAGRVQVLTCHLGNVLAALGKQTTQREQGLAIGTSHGGNTMKSGILERLGCNKSNVSFLKRSELSDM